MIDVFLNRRLLTVEDYYKMASAGILYPDENVELINGIIFNKFPKTPTHASTVNKLSQRFILKLLEKAIVRVQNPVRLSNLSEPEPDLSILKPKADFYGSGHPTPEDILFLIEVAESSLVYDREVKLPLYAKASIPGVWIVNLEDNQVEIYTSPEGNAYQNQKILTNNQKIHLPAFDLEIPVSRILF